MAGISDLGAALISGGSSLLGGLTSSIGNIIATGSANRTSKKIARENMQWQSKENQLNRDWQEKMWNAENQYNTPSAMMQRYKQAGLNPYLAGDGSPTIGAAGSAGTPSMVGAPNMPNIQRADLSGLGAGIASAGSNMVSTLLQAKSVDANVMKERAEMAKTLVEGYKEAFQTGGKKAADAFKNKFADFLDGSDPESGMLYRMFRSQVYNIDMDSLNKEFQYDVNKRWTDREKQAAFDNVVASTRQALQQVSLLKSQESVNSSTIKNLAAQTVKAFAEAYGAQKQGDYYMMSAAQVSIMNKMLDLQYQDLEADFQMNAPLREAKRNNIMLGMRVKGNFEQGLKAGSVQLGIQSNTFLQNFKAYTGAIGQLVKVNFGVSNNRTNFNNLNPDKPSTMFYSGDGYYMDHGTLLKGNW